jgi:hypothetical protein
MHFFIDHTKFPNPAQSATDYKFGPDTDPLLSHSVFQLSTQFQLITEARAYACQEGFLIVQQDNQHSNLVNVVIKPLNPVKINGITVRYYFYRGIELSSFFTQSENEYIINPNNVSENTEFVSYFWNLAMIAGSANSNQLPGRFGYGENNLSISFSSSLIDERKLSDIFSYENPIAIPHHVHEGMWIGNFTTSTKISFEIELETELSVASNLGICRASSLQIQTGGLSGLALKRRKEDILGYIDPAAFFGMHAEIGVATKTDAGVKNNKKLLALYTDIISKFSNKNRVYLDIRNENGLSYNFYDTYKASSSNAANIKINDSEMVYGATISPIYGWPIYFFEAASQHAQTNFNKLNINLCKTDNNNPVLYVENKNFSASNNKDKINFYKDNEISNPLEPIWTNTITLYYPHARNTNKNNIATYIKLYYYLEDPVIASTNRLRNEKYYSMPFCPIDLENLGDVTVKNERVENYNTVYIKEKLNENNGTGNFSYAATSGAYWDTNRVLFYCKFINKANSSGSGKQYINTFKKNLSLNNTKYSKEFQNDFFIVCKKYQTLSGDLKILGLNSYHPNRKLEKKEDLLLLGLTITEIQLLKTVFGLSPHHSKYIYLEPDYTNHLVDIHGYRYYRYIVKVQGLDSNGIPQIVAMPPLLSINVYSRDNMFFHSQSFAANENYSMGNDYPGDNRIEFNIFGNNGHIYINDNIDFSLIRKKYLGENSLSNVDGTPVYTLSDDDIIPNDTSEVQKIYYLYYENMPNVITANTLYTEICHLDIIMENKRKQDSTTPQESAAVSDANFSALGYNLEINFEQFNFDRVWAKKSYKHTNKDILVRGKITNSGSIGNRKYISYDNKIFMVYIEKEQINACTLTENKFTWDGTVRLFARPDLFAVFLGALIDISDINSGFLNTQNIALACGGFAFPDASSFPSKLHVNGDAFDTNYFINTNDNFAFISAIHKYGVGNFKIGIKSALTPLFNQVTDAEFRTLSRNTEHDSHLHTQDIKIEFR